MIIHILRHHIFGIFGPPPPPRQYVLSTKNKQKLAFSDPPYPPTSADVIYEWSLRFHTKWQVTQVKTLTWEMLICIWSNLD